MRKHLVAAARGGVPQSRQVARRASQMARPSLSISESMATTHAQTGAKPFRASAASIVAAECYGFSSEIDVKRPATVGTHAPPSNREASPLRSRRTHTASSGGLALIGFSRQSRLNVRRSLTSSGSVFMAVFPGVSHRSDFNDRAIRGWHYRNFLDLCCYTVAAANGCQENDYG